MFIYVAIRSLNITIEYLAFLRVYNQFTVSVTKILYKETITFTVVLCKYVLSVILNMF